jgi:mannonate dehydratase
MKQLESRRKFMRKSAAFAGAAAGLGTMSFSQAGGAATWEPKVSENIGSLDDATLTWLAQLGLKWVVLQGTDAVDHAKKGYWSAGDIRAVQERCRQFGMELATLMIPLSWLMNSMLGKPVRDRDIENIQRSIRSGGEAGVPVFEWRWSPDFKWGADVGYSEVKGRGGAGYRSFDYDLVRNKPPFPELGEITAAELWDRMMYFLKPVVETAETAGVKLSLHPKDPPVPVMRGIHRLLTDTDQIEKFLDAVPSPANGFTFCQGTVTEMGVDVIDAIRRIGRRGRIHHVHFRGVRGSVPKYVETFIDDGDVDMLAAMRAYKEVGYTGTMVSDHTPQVIGEISGGKVGRSFSQGYIRGLVQAVNAEG